MVRNKALARIIFFGVYGMVVIGLYLTDEVEVICLEVLPVLLGVAIFSSLYGFFTAWWEDRRTGM